MRQFRSMVYPYVIWITIMIVVPMLMILLYAFTTAGNEVTTIRFTLDNFIRFFNDAVFLDVLNRSLRTAGLSHCLCHCKRTGKKQNVLDFNDYTAHLDQYASADLCLGRYPAG